MKKVKYYFPRLFITIVAVLFVNHVFAQDVPLRKVEDSATDGLTGKLSKTRLYIPLSVSFESGELALFFESTVGMCNVSIEDENGNVQMSEIIDTDNGSEFWFDLSGLSSGLHYVKISYGSMSLVGEFYVE